MFLVEFKTLSFLFSAPSNGTHFETQRLMGYIGTPLEVGFSRLVISASEITQKCSFVHCLFSE